MKDQNQKSGGKSTCYSHKKNKLPRNKPYQGGKNLYSENYTHWREQLRKTQRNGSIHHAHGLEESMSSNCPYYPKLFIDSMQSQLKYQWHISHI